MKPVKYVIESNSDTIGLLHQLIFDKDTWEDNPKGYSNIGAFIGTSKEDPNMLSLIYVSISGVIVCFYEPTSVKVDFEKVENYITNTFPDAEDITATRLVVKYKNGTL